MIKKDKTHSRKRRLTKKTVTTQYTINHHTKQKRRLVKTKKRQTGGGVSSLHIRSKEDDKLLRMISDNQQTNEDIHPLDNMYETLRKANYSTKYTFTNRSGPQTYLTGSLIQHSSDTEKIYLIGLFKRRRNDSITVELFPIYKSIDSSTDANSFFKKGDNDNYVLQTKKIHSPTNKNLFDTYKLFQEKVCPDTNLSIPLSYLYYVYMFYDEGYMDKLQKIVDYYIKDILNDIHKNEAYYMKIFSLNLFNYIYASFGEYYTQNGREYKNEQQIKKNDSIFTIFGFQYDLGKGYTKEILNREESIEGEVAYFYIRNTNDDILCEPIGKLGTEYTLVSSSVSSVSSTGSSNVRDRTGSVTVDTSRMGPISGSRSASSHISSH